MEDDGSPVVKRPVSAKEKWLMATWTINMVSNLLVTYSYYMLLVVSPVFTSIAFGLYTEL